MVNEVNSATQALAKPPRDRSPAYPFISLKVAIERLAAFEAMFGRHPTPVDKAGLAWKMKEKSSQAFQTLAALKSFGLVGYHARTVSLSTDGRNYLRAQQESVKAEILKRCAVNPKTIASYWKAWGADRPIDPICLDELTLKGGFTDSAAATFLRVYDETVAYAGLVNGDTIRRSDEADDDASEAESDMQQATAPTQRQESAGAPPQPASPPTFVMTSQGTGSVEKSEREWLRGPLSREVSYRLIVSGDLGPKEIGKLIKLLKAQQAVLSDEDDDEDDDKGSKD